MPVTGEPNGTPTPYEMMRVLERIDKRLDGFERTHVRLDVYHSDRQTTDVHTRGIETEQHAQAKRLEALATKADASIKEIGDRLDKHDDRRRSDRLLLLGGVAFPIVVFLIAALFAAGGIR